MKAVSWNDFRERAMQNHARMILADGVDSRALEAARIAKTQKIAEPILLDSAIPSDSDRWVQALTALPKYRELSPEQAQARVKDPLIRGCLMVRQGQADGFIG